MATDDAVEFYFLLLDYAFIWVQFEPCFLASLYHPIHVIVVFCICSPRDGNVISDSYHSGTSLECLINLSSGGVVVRALASHQCGPGSIPTLRVICGLSLLVLYSALRGFSPGTRVFPSPQKPTFGDNFSIYSVPN